MHMISKRLALAFLTQVNGVLNSANSKLSADAGIIVSRRDTALEIAGTWRASA